MRNYFYRWLLICLDLFFPPNCVGCNKSGVHLCPSCQADIVQLLPPCCEICGKSQPEISICSDCKKYPPKIRGLRSWAYYEGPIRDAIHQLKYHRNIVLGQVFSENLFEVINNTDWDIDLILPVPLGVVRRKKRGYNQAALLAYPLAMGLNRPYKPRAIVRIRETKSQVELDLHQRKKNVEGAFSANSSIIAGKNVLVVDDVTTSGATLEACAEALIYAGARNVYGLTLARA